MQTFDYVVIGSGPGGSACARTLALKSKEGKRVALLERGGRVPFTDCLGEYSGCAILCRASGLRRVPSTSDTLCSVLGSNSKPLRGGAGIYVADASLARHVPVVNTMSIAAYSGYVSAVLALESGERESK